MPFTCPCRVCGTAVAGLWFAPPLCSDCNDREATDVPSPRKTLGQSREFVGWQWSEVADPSQWLMSQVSDPMSFDYSPDADVQPDAIVEKPCA